MRDAAFMAFMMVMLPLVVARPFVGVLLWSWISFLNPHRTLWGFAGELPWAALVFCATLAGCVLAGEPKRLTLNAITALILALMVCITMTSLAALGPPDAVWAKWQQTEKAMLALLLTASLLRDRWRLHAIVWIMVISVAYYSVRGGIFTIVTAGSFRVFGPPQTMIEDNNHLAAAMLVTLPLMNYLRMHSRHAAVRWALVAAMALTLLSIVGSYSRGALLGLAVSTLILWLRGRRKVVSGVVLAVGVAGAIAYMPDSWTQRMETINTYKQDESASDRLRMWETGWKLALERPLVGAGFAGPYTREVVDLVDPLSPARAVHSIWFEFLGEHGFPSFFVWLGLTLSGAAYTVRLMRLARGRPELAWAYDFAGMAQVSIAAYVVTGTFLSLSYWDFYWTLLVAVAAAHTLAVRSLQERGAAAAAARGRGLATLRQAAAPGGWRGMAGAAAASEAEETQGDAGRPPRAGRRPLLAAWRGGGRKNHGRGLEADAGEALR